MRFPRRALPIALTAALAACSDDRPPAAAVQPVEPDITASPLPAAEPIEPVKTEMVTIPAGSYRSFFPGKDESKMVEVEAFRIEEHAVTNGQFEAFVRANPRWRRSHVRRLFADTNYLTHWQSDVDAGDDIDDRPVTNVSWFAARAYAGWIGRRLPTLQEWEYVALASETAAQGGKEEGFNQRILDWYSKPTTAHPQPVRSAFKNFYGVHDMHGLIWEWVENFNTALVTGESRGDTGLDRTLFCGAGSSGSANPADYASFMRFAFRSSLKAVYASKRLGFRCAGEGPSCCEELASAATLPDTSVYQLASEWYTQRGDKIHLERFRGQPVVAAMMFTTCEYACPRIIADLKAIETRIPAANLPDVQFVLISFDSERDLPAVLEEYARKNALDQTRWTLLHGADADVRELAAVLGVKYKKSAAVGFSHSNLITVLDAKGRAVHQQKGIGAPPEPSVAAIVKLTNRR